MPTPFTPEQLLEFPRHFFGGEVYAKELWMRKCGQSVQQHIHAYDHLSLLVRGSARVTVDGVGTDYQSPTGITIAAGKSHTVLALEDDTLWYCVHAVPSELRGATVVAIDEVLVQEPRA
jgi:quercetin dioxygenase-like cupin family protein